MTCDPGRFQRTSIILLKHLKLTRYLYHLIFLQCQTNGGAIEVTDPIPHQDGGEDEDEGVDEGGAEDLKAHPKPPIWGHMDTLGGT